MNLFAILSISLSLIGVFRVNGECTKDSANSQSYVCIGNFNFSQTENDENAIQSLLLKNPVEEIRKSDLEKLTNLKNLEVITSSKNSPGNVCAPPNLKSLKLSGTEENLRISESTLENCGNLEELTLEEIDYIEADEPFKDLTNLKVLNIKKLQEKTLKKDHFQGLSTLKILHINHCGVEFIESDTFEKIGESLVHVSLRNNHLHNFETGTFDNLKNLKELDLSANWFRTIDWEWFKGLKSLEILNLSELDLTEINQDELLTKSAQLKKIIVPKQAKIGKDLIEKALKEKNLTIEMGKDPTPETKCLQIDFDDC